ncbi:RING/U-box superfamily protein [Rhynchospora pubera]|uniref:RING/U-box superfamily protein n=1 Tax=Rhynchospora pubera TaxID=906938 RepID=A0AAV8EC07_9POAL|nr:RING/U-box superfamily protein [Rhynchospora pubera]
MGMQQSKDQLLYEQVNYGNVEGIKSLRSQGAGLEWIDKDGKTPLILACLRHDLLNVAKVLIELGANVNAYRPGSHAGTPLHHAAKKGLEQTVHLLMTNGANPFIMNDDCHTPLDLSREKGHVNVVRAIEGRICLFCGWLRENFGPGFLEALAPQLMSRKVWGVVLPCDSRSPSRPVKFELALYTDLTAAKPTKVIHLWKCHLEEPKFNQADPSLIIIEKSSRVKYKFLSANEGDKGQLQSFFNACKGLIPQHITVMPAPPPGVVPVHNQVHGSNPPMPAITAGPAVQAPSKVPPLPHQEDMELAMAINASIQSAIIEGVPDVLPVVPVAQSKASLGTNGWATSSSTPSTFNGWGPPSSGTKKAHTDEASTSTTLNGWGPPATSQSQTPVQTPSAPSAPPINESFYTVPIQYPSIDSSLITISTATGTGSSDKKEEGAGTCVICLDAPVEGACIPCGHMAGCMGCLREIEEKRGECPICRAKINQVLKLYAV